MIGHRAENTVCPPTPTREQTPHNFGLPVARPDGHGALGPFLRRLVLLLGLISGPTLIGTLGLVITENVSVWHGFIWALDTIATVGSIPSPESGGVESR